MKIFVLLISSCFLLSFTIINRNVNLCVNKHFKLLSATSSSWTAGTLSGGNGTEFYFKIVIKTKQKIVFDSVWVENHSSKIFISKKQKSISSAPIDYNKGDTITLRISMSNNNLKQIKSPKKISKGALLSYRIKDKLKYYTINKIETQTPTYYP